MASQDYPPVVVQPPQYPEAMLAQTQPVEYGDEMDQGRSLREMLYILWNRKWWVVGTFLAVWLLAAVYTLTRTPIFRTTSTLQITEDNPGSKVSAGDQMAQLSSFGDTMEKFQQTQYKILQSRSLALRVIQALNLGEHPDFKGIRAKNPEWTSSEVEEVMVAMFQKKLEVTPIKNTYLVEVSFLSPDKALVQKVVNTVANEYMFLSIDRRNESFSLVRTWLDRQLKEMAVKVQDTQKKLYKFGQQTDIYTLEDKDNVIVQKFIDLSGLLTKAQAEKMGKEAQYQQIKSKGANAPLIVNHPLVATLRQQVVAQQAKVSALQKVFLPGHPEMQAEKANLGEVQKRLAAEVQRVQDSIRSDYEAANRTAILLNDSLVNQKSQVAKLQDNLTDFQILKRDAQTNEQLYQALLARVKEANISSTMVPSNVAVIDPGPLPSKPSSPKTGRNLLLAGLLGLGLGVGLALVVEHLDDSIKSVDDLERFCHLPSVGVVPLLASNGSLGSSLGQRIMSSSLGRYLPWHERWRQSQPDTVPVEDLDLVVYKNPKDPITEAVRHTQTSIMLSASGRPPCILMITSANPSEGKTTIAANLAQAFALNDRETVIIDCDLRKPRVHQIFKIPSQPGLTNYLSGNATLEEILRPTKVPNLTLIAAGARPPNPVNLLHSEIFKDLLQQLRGKFRHIIIDTPPILGFSDARMVSALVDGVLLVTKQNSTQKSAGRLAQQFLSQIHAPILGAVLNGVSTSGGGYYYSFKDYAKYYGGNET